MRRIVLYALGWAYLFLGSLAVGPPDHLIAVSVSTLIYVFLEDINRIIVSPITGHDKRNIKFPLNIAFVVH